MLQSEIVHRVILPWQFIPFKLLLTSSNSYRPVTFKFVAAARLIPYFSAIYSHETFRLPCSRFEPTVVSYPVVSHQARTIRIHSVESFFTVRNDSTDISIKYVFLVKYVKIRPVSYLKYHYRLKLDKEDKFLKKLWCCVGGRVQQVI